MSDETTMPPPVTAPVDCAAVLERLDLYLDGELPPDELDALAEHIDVCFPCADRATFGEQLRALVRVGCAEQAPARLRTRILDHLGSADA